MGTSSRMQKLLRFALPNCEYGHINLLKTIYKQNGTLRPQNTQLYVRETEDLMEGFGGLGWNPFEEWWTEHLTKTQ